MTDNEDTTSETPVKRRKKLQPSWHNCPTQADLDNDYKSAESSQDAFKAKLEEWLETRSGGDDIIVSGVGKSKARPLVVRKNNEWKYPALEEPFLNTSDLFRVSPATHADTEAAEQNSQILNYQWNTKVQKTKIVSDIVHTVVDEGTVIVKTGWDAEYDIEVVDEEVPVYASPEESIMLMQQAVQSGQMTPEQARAMLETGEPMTVGSEIEKVEREVLVKNQPTYEVCVTANVTIDPTCDGVVADALFAIHEYDTSYADLKSNEHYVDEEGNEHGVYYNLDFITLDRGADDSYDESLSDASNNFEFKDKARRRLKAYEYWGYWDIQGDGELVSIVGTWIGTTLIRLEENPFPHKRIPFSVATYMPVSNNVHGEPDAELLRENQESIGKMTRAIHDITARQAVGQEFIDENFFPSPSVKNAYEKGQTVYYRSGFKASDAVYRKDIQQVGSTPFDVIKWQTADGNELTGTKPFGGAGGARMEGSAQVRDSMDATAKRELSILRRLSDLLFVDMARMTVAMNQAWLSEEEVIRITDKEFVVIKRDDLQGDFDLRVQVSTPEKDDDQATKIMKLMQTNGASMSPEIAKMHYVQLASLWNLDALATAVKEYEPQPNPKEEELMDLQLEEQKLKNALAAKQLEDYDSKIYERLSRTEENAQGDAKLKQAKAQQAISTAAKLDEETDILSQSFLFLQDGTKRQQDIEDQEYKLQGEMAKQQQKDVNAESKSKTDDLRQAGIEHIQNAYTRTPGKTLAEI